jgi:branched-chain amino acid transport system permease protein
LIWPQYLVNGAIQGLYIALLGISFGIVYRSVKVFHVAFAAIYTLPPYVLWACLGHGLPWPFSLVLSIAAGILLSLSCEVVNHFPLSVRKASSEIQIIASLGTYIVVIQAIALAWGNEAKFLHPGAHASYRLGAITVAKSQVITGLVSAALLAVSWLLLRLTATGLRLRTLAENPGELVLRGYNIRRFRLLVFGLSAFICGIAANLIAFDVGFDPYVGLQALLLAVAATVVGGRNTFFGPVVGGFLIGILRSLTVLWLSPSWREGVTFAVLVIFLLCLPRGLLGTRTRVEADL